MPDQQMAEESPLFLRDQWRECLFNLLGRVLRGQTKTFGQTPHVRVDYNPEIDIESIPQHNVGGFAANSAKFP